MHIFITGIAGFLGSNLAEYYLKKNFKVSGCDNLIGGNLDNINQDKINFFKADCEDFEEMKKIINDVDVLCHAAAYAHEGLSSFSPVLITNNNVTGSVSVFTAAIINKVKRIVYCSSMARYGNIKIPFREDDELKPVDPYGVSKVAAENILKILSKTHNVEYNIPFIVLELSPGSVLLKPLNGTGLSVSITKSLLVTSTSQELPL